MRAFIITEIDLLGPPDIALCMRTASSGFDVTVPASSAPGHASPYGRANSDIRRMFILAEGDLLGLPNIAFPMRTALPGLDAAASAPSVPGSSRQASARPADGLLHPS